MSFSESLAQSLSLVELIGLSRRAILSAPMSRIDFSMACNPCSWASMPSALCEFRRCLVYCAAFLDLALQCGDQDSQLHHVFSFSLITKTFDLFGAGPADLRVSAAQKIC